MKPIRIELSPNDLWALGPELVLLGFSLAVLLLGVFLKGERRRYTGYVSLFGYVCAFLPLLWERVGGQEAFFGMVSNDYFSLYFKVLVLTVGFLVVMVSLDFTVREGVAFGEYYALMMIASVGMMLMASSVHMVSLFLGLEIMSLSIYALCGITREDPRSVEAAFKYFLLGAFASALFLYGMALLYSVSGSFHFKTMAEFFAENPFVLKAPLFLVGFSLFLLGFAFKLALVPLHMWTPDVYEGAPTPITAFMAAGVKAAAFAAFLRAMLSAFNAFPKGFEELLWVLSVATMTVGNLIALKQEDVKRMLAYSSIAHAGYILIGFIAGGERGQAAVLFYLYAYAFMNVGAFTVVAALGRKGQPNTSLEAYAGVGFKRPLLSLAMAAFLFSLAGVPPTAGFMAKFYVFSAAVKAGYYWLAVLGVLNSAVAAYYYLRVLVYMYFREPKEGIELGGVSLASILSLLLTLWGVFQLGIKPSEFLALAEQSIRAIL